MNFYQPLGFFVSWVILMWNFWRKSKFIYIITSKTSVIHTNAKLSPICPMHSSILMWRGLMCIYWRFAKFSFSVQECCFQKSFSPLIIQNFLLNIFQRKRASFDNLQNLHFQFSNVVSEKFQYTYNSKFSAGQSKCACYWYFLQNSHFQFRNVVP